MKQMVLPSALKNDLLNPSDEHQMLRQTLVSFVKEQVEPQAEEHDQKGSLNRELLTQCAKLDLLGVTIPEEHGGIGMDAVASCIVHEELAYSDPGFALAYLAHAVLFVNNMFFAGNDEQRKKYMPKVLDGTWLGGMGMTEPSAGTDVLGMGTVAKKDGDFYRLTGRKIFITNAPDADVYCLYAKLDGRITTFIVEKTFDGFSTSPKIPKCGMRASTMGELILDDCKVPLSNLLGTEGGGIINMMRNLELERMTLAAISIGIGRRCLDTMTRYSTERQAFKGPLSKLGQIQRHIGNSYAKLEAMRALVYGTASTLSPTEKNRLGSDAAKLYAAEAAKEIADSAIQVLGGYGYCTEYRVEQFWRDAKLIEIGGGTNEAHQKNITKDLCKLMTA